MIKKLNNNKFINNLSWIFVGNVAHAILSFLLNIYVARVINVGDYGLINYASSWISFFSSLCTLGFNGVITKKFADDYESAGKYLGTAILLRFLSSAVSVGALQIIAGISPDEPLLRAIVLCQSMTIVFGSLDVFIYWFQYNNGAKLVALLRFGAFIVSAAARITVLLTTKSVIQYVAATSIETVVFGVSMLCAFKKEHQFKLSFSIHKAKAMLRISYPFIFAAIMTTIYGQTDKIMLKNMLSNEAVASYSVALTLAGVISIVPAALIEGFRPDIMTYKLSNEELYKKRLRQLYAAIFWLCIAFCLFVTFFAKYIVLILYGEKYLAAIPVLSLVVWYTSFSYFGAVNSMYMVAESKAGWVQVTTLVGMLLNICMNFILIPVMGAMGAALASLLTQIVANFILIAIVPQLRGCFRLIIGGIFLQKVF